MTEINLHYNVHVMCGSKTNIPPPMEDSFICAPYPQKFLFQGSLMTPLPPPPLGIPKTFKWGLLTTLGNSKWFWYFKKRK